MKLISWNVNGYRAAAKKGFFDFLKVHKPDVCCIQEAKAMMDQLTPDLANPAPYRFSLNSAERKGYSGVAAFCLKEPVSISDSFGVKKYDAEGRVQEIEFKSFRLFNVYFPNGKKDSDRLKYKMGFYRAFLKHLDSLGNKRIVVCGDVNTAHTEIDLSHPKQNEKTSGFLPEERKWIDDLLDHGYVDSFRHFNTEPENYTWWDLRTRARARNVGWRLDYFFVSRDLVRYLKSAFILKDVMGSDHCPVGIELSLKA